MPSSAVALVRAGLVCLLAAGCAQGMNQSSDAGGMDAAAPAAQHRRAGLNAAGGTMTSGAFRLQSSTGQATPVSRGNSRSTRYLLRHGILGDTR